MDRSLVAAGSLALGAVVLAYLAWPSQPAPPALEVVASHRAQPITVHVSGAVQRPGLVTLGRDARVADAILAAGGATDDAELGSLNLAATLGDGTRLVVPSTSDATPTGGDGMVRLNSATAAELQELPGVGPVLAERIVAHRDDRGPFAAIEDLLDVPGIGEAKLEALRDSVLVP